MTHFNTLTKRTEASVILFFVGIFPFRIRAGFSDFPVLIQTEDPPEHKRMNLHPPGRVFRVMRKGAKKGYNEKKFRGREERIIEQG